MPYISPKPLIKARNVISRNKDVSIVSLDQAVLQKVLSLQHRSLSEYNRRKSVALNDYIGFLDEDMK
jgi:hypothetical protein